MRGVLLLMCAVCLAGCAGERGLHDLTLATGGPDDFSVLPVAPLTIPDTLDLPAPTPGGANLTDPDPQADAIVALGGRPAAAIAGGVPAGDAALVAATGRFGVDADVRAALAASDAAFRGRRGLLGGGYFGAYAGQALDAYAELNRFRNLGVATPSAPPLQ